MRGPNHYRSLDDQQQHPWNPQEDRSGQMRREDLKLPQNPPEAAPEENRSANDRYANYEREEAAFRRGLDEKLATRKINESEHTRELAKFDNAYSVEKARQEHLAQAREAIAELRQREAERQREQGRER